MRFGQELRQLFELDPEVNPLNHGSSGAVPKPVFEAQMRAHKRRARFPDAYYKPLHDGDELRTRERQLISKVVDSDWECTFFAQNTSIATQTVMRSFTFNKGDRIVYLSTIFQSFAHVLEYLQERLGVEPMKFEVELPLSETEFLAAFKQCLEETKPRMAVFDVVSSVPAVKFPWEKMCDICNQLDILSFVDGAHGIGLVEISLNKAKPTFFASNIHKWYWTTQSLAVVYIDKSMHRKIQGFPISTVSIKDERPDRAARLFAYAATQDYTVIDSVPAAVEFREALGEANIVNYHTELAEAACAYICKEWAVPELKGYTRIAMFNIECPMQPGDFLAFKDFVSLRLLEKHRSFVTLFKYRGTAYLRFSATAYLDLDDFKRGVRDLNECFSAYAKIG